MGGRVAPQPTGESAENSTFKSTYEFPHHMKHPYTPEDLTLMSLLDHIQQRPAYLVALGYLEAHRPPPGGAPELDSEHSITVDLVAHLIEAQLHGLSIDHVTLAIALIDAGWQVLKTEGVLLLTNFPATDLWRRRQESDCKRTMTLGWAKYSDAELTAHLQ